MLSVVMGAQLCKFAKNHGIVYLDRILKMSEFYGI